MFMKKKGPPMSDHEVKAKTHVIEAMRDMAAQAMGDKLKGLKKVTVASNDQEGLKMGLDKAKELLNKKPDASEEGDDEAGEDEEGEENSHDMPTEMHVSHDEGDSSDASPFPQEGGDDLAGMTDESIEAQIQKLMALKAKLDARKA